MSRTAFALLFVIVLGGAPALRGQSNSAFQAPEEPSLRRVSFGGRFSVLGNNLIVNKSVSRSTSEPPVSTTLLSDSTSSRFGGGLTLQFAILEKLAVSFDVLYRRAGYQSSVDVFEGVDNPDTSADERKLTTTLERTTAEYWDLPILARFYSIGRHQEGPRIFFDGGVALRHMTNVRTFREFIRPDGLSDTDETAVTPANTTITGFVVGCGLQLMDNVRLKFMPEVRFTRWFNRTFEASPTLASKNQLEVLLGFTW